MVGVRWVGVHSVNRGSARRHDPRRARAAVVVTNRARLRLECHHLLRLLRLTAAASSPTARGTADSAACAAANTRLGRLPLVVTIELGLPNEDGGERVRG
jgi:hypothetical protein